jgi:hypothetical protein
MHVRVREAGRVHRRLVFLHLGIGTQIMLSPRPSAMAAFASVKWSSGILQDQVGGR